MKILPNPMIFCDRIKVKKIQAERNRLALLPFRIKFWTFVFRAESGLSQNRWSPDRKAAGNVSTLLPMPVLSRLARLREKQVRTGSGSEPGG